jgi:iron complex transport system ATP-binding protein
MPPVPGSTPVLELRGVSVRHDGRPILGPIDWTIRSGERWAIVGPNGAGKTTLVQVASSYLWPTSGSVRVLGQTIGDADARILRERIGYAGSGLERAIGDEVTALDLVVSARHAALGTWWHRYTDDDRERAHALLERLGVGAFAASPMGILSTGERRRVQIARALMPDPAFLILDEPAAGLDLGARESLIDSLDTLAADDRLGGIVLVSHHLEEIPASFGHALVLGGGLAVAAGPIEEVLADGPLSAAFGLPLTVERRDGRLSAHGVTQR